MMVSSFIGAVLDFGLEQTFIFWVRRIVPGFLVQTGDKTGTGGGGESFYGGTQPFVSAFGRN